MRYKLGLTGFPLDHSLSPKLHNAALRTTGLEGDYSLLPVSPDDPQGLFELTCRLKAGDLNGLNVTIPYKKAIIPLVDILTSTAQAIGAVNTLYVLGNHLIGHNTDAPGFHSDLARFLPPGNLVKEAIVLGAGGAARAVIYALLTDKWKVTLAVRSADWDQASALMEAAKLYASDSYIRSVMLDTRNLSQLNQTRLIVNATPLGMFPEIENSPWPAGCPFPEGAAVYDLIYNPPQTRLVKRAKAAGLQATTGLGMLVEQARLSFTCWTGRVVPREVFFAGVEA
jgi:shikimate dehydrogenase